MFLTGEVWKWVNCPIGKKEDNFRGFASSAVSLIRVFDVFS